MISADYSDFADYAENIISDISAIREISENINFKIFAIRGFALIRILASHSMKISMIVVVGKNREIGCQNKLLWSLPEDMDRFKKITTGHIVIMGSKTFESLGRPLPNRTNIVIAFDQNYQAPGAIVVNSPEAAIAKAKELKPDDEVFIIGGGSIYKVFLPQTEKLYITVVDDEPEADTFFPDYSEFQNIIFEETHETDDLKFTFFELTR